MAITRKGERRTNGGYASIQKFFKRTVGEPEGAGKGDQRKGLRKSRRTDRKDDWPDTEGNRRQLKQSRELKRAADTKADRFKKMIAYKDG